jgi:hypothetical protein
MDNIFKILGLNSQNGLYILAKNNWKGILSEKTEKIFEKTIKPNAFFLFNDTPFILFFDNPNNKSETLKQCWNLNKTPIVFIVSSGEVEVYNGLSFLKEQNTANLLESKNWKEDFSFFNIISGKTWEKYRTELTLNNKVDDKLLENIEAVRDILTIKYQLPSNITNNLIGRLIFVRYLIDRDIVIGFNDNNNGVLSNDSLCNVLKSESKTYKLFEYLRNKFNGNLFPIDKEEKELVKKEHLKVLIDLLNGMEISSGQMSLFDVYDFSIIPIELISNVYEFFIGQKEQEKKGTYYTPLFLVNQVLDETVHSYFKKNQTVYNSKILDPACGSGVFLVEALRKIISQYQKNTPNYSSDLENYKKQLKQLLTDNIFGIDKDENAINIAIFSLYITLLDYLEPPEIVNFKFPPLLNKNFFVEDFFDTNAEYNNSLSKKNNHFNFIVGNPPWGKIKDSVHLYEKYWKQREIDETKQHKEVQPDFNGKVQIKVSRKEIAQVFLIRVSDFSFDECAFVITSKILYNLKADIFRKYFLENFAIRKVFEMSSLRHEIFDKSNDPASCPATILYYSHSKNIEENRQNLVTHISLKPNLFFEFFKILTVEKHDQKQLYQSYFMDYDWIWKVLVYGNILDFYLMKRLNDGYKKIVEILDTDNFVEGQGLKFKDGDMKKSTRHLNDLRFFETEKKNIQQYYIREVKEKWDNKKLVGYLPKDERIFYKPTLVITGGTNNSFKSVSAIINYDAVFKSSLTAVKAINPKDISVLKSINSLLNSDLFAYYITSIGSSVGIEREETHDEEKFNFPYNTSSKLVKLVTAIEKEAKIINETEIKVSVEYSNAKNKYNQLLTEIDDEIYKLFKITKQEKALIDYAQEISIPLIKRRDKNRIFGHLYLQNDEHKKYLSKYVEIFLNHYNNIYNSDGYYFEIEVWHSQYMIGMYFKIITEPSKVKNQIIWKQDIKSEKLLKKFTAISISKQNQDLFVQKDIKGFEEKGFYVIKPNEYKNWHRALAHLDLNEFIDAIMQATKEEDI